MSLKTNNLHSPNQEVIPQTDEMLLINPTPKEFTTTYFDDENKQVKVTIPPLASQSWPRHTGEIVLKHLMNFVLNQNGFSYKTDVNLELAKIREKCLRLDDLPKEKI